MIITDKQVWRLIKQCWRYANVCKQMEWNDHLEECNLLLNEIEDQQYEKLKEVKSDI
jgi:hypothetical protein